MSTLTAEFSVNIPKWSNNLVDQLKHHLQFSEKQFDEQYNLRAGRPDYEVTVIPNWEKKSERVRQELNCSLDIRYGPGKNQNLDI